MQRIRYSRYFKTIFILIDIVVIAAVFVYFFLRNNDHLFAEENSEQNILSIVLLIFYWVLLSSRTKLYSIARNITYTIYLERLITHIFIFIFGVILLAKVSNNDFLKQDRFLIALSLFFLLFMFKSILFFTLKYIRTKGLNYRNIMFLSIDSLHYESYLRKEKYIHSLSTRHLVIAIMFTNTGVNDLIYRKTKTSREIYEQVLAEQQAVDQMRIQRRLRTLGVECVLTTPQNLSVDSLNKYLELKAMGRT